MAFNKGYELKKFEAHWEKLRIEYAEAGMADDAIQKMYDYDRQQFNSKPKAALHGLGKSRTNVYLLHLNI